MKNIRVVFSLIIAMVVLVFSTVCFAGSGNSREAVTTDEGHVLEEGGDGSEIVILQCGSDTTYNQQEIRKGAPNIQYSVRTIGIRESEIDLSKEEILEVDYITNVKLIEREGKRKVRMVDNEGSPIMVNDEELTARIVTYCLGGDGRTTKNISLTDDSWQCDRNQGIRLNLSKPVSTEDIKFYAVLELTKIVHKDPIEEPNESEKPEQLSIPGPEPTVLALLEDAIVRRRVIRHIANQGGVTERSVEIGLLGFEIQKIEEEKRKLENEMEEDALRAQQLQERVGRLLRTRDAPPEPTPQINPPGIGVIGTSFSGSC